MNTVEVQVIEICKEKDWGTGLNKEQTTTLKVDADVAHIAKTFKVRDLSKVARGKATKSKPSYVLHSVGSQSMVSGETSIGSYLYGVAPGTRRVKNTPDNEFTRQAYGLN